MRRQRPSLLAVTLAVLLSVVPATAQEGKVYIEINPSDQRRLPIAISEFVNATAPAGDAGIGKLVAEVVGKDLEFTGLFRVLDPAGFIEDPTRRAVALQEIDFRDWTSAGAEALVKGRYRLDGSTLKVEAFLYDPIQGTQVLGREYTANVETARRIAHRFASDVLEALSGEPGIFDTRLAFVSNRSGTKELYVMDYDGHGVRRLTTTQSINLVPTWSPDGRQIAFVSFMERNPDLFFLSVDTGQLLRLRLPFSWRGSFNGGAWSPGGKLFGFGVSREGNSEIYVMDVDGRNLRAITNHFAQDVAPAFSPDGRQIVFVSDRSGNPNLYVTDLKGESVRRLTFEGKYNASPAWSPRGDRIAFACQNERGRFDICVISSDGTGLARLTSEGASDSPTWSPDGRFIAYQSNRDGGTRLWVMNANGANQRRLLPVGLGGQGDDTSPAWSPRSAQ